MATPRSRLSGVGRCWAALSVVSAAATAAAFFLPYWIRGRIDDVDTFFGPFRRCNYPRYDQRTGSVEVVTECGRYTSFADIPSVSWQICTIVVGAAACLALLVAFGACAAACCSDVIDRSSARVAGVIQLVSAVMVLVGCAIFPNGWHSQEVRDACGGRSEAFELGTCTVSWSYYCLGLAALGTVLCAALSPYASNVTCRSTSYRL